MKVPYIHIYAQAWNHSDAFIVGNKEGLIALADALDMVSAHWNDDIIGVDVFANNGEGYKIIIKRTSDEDMQQLKLPYPDDEVHGNEVGGKSPFELVGKEAYIKLLGK